MNLPQQEKPSFFPANRAEAMKFRNDVMQVLYDERTHGGIVEQLQAVGNKDIGQSLGMIAGNIVGNRVGDVRAQTGRSIEMKLVAGAVKAVVMELAEIAEDNGLFKTPPEEQKEAFQVAIQLLDELAKNSQGQQQAPQQPQQQLPPMQGGA